MLLQKGENALGCTGRPVLFRTSIGVEESRITRTHQMLSVGREFSVADLGRMQHDACSLRAERDLPLFPGWTRTDADVEKARLAIDRLAKDWGADWGRVIDLSNIDNSVATNAPGQSAQPGSPCDSHHRERLANRQDFPLPYTRGAVDRVAAHTLTLTP